MKKIPLLATALLACSAAAYAINPYLPLWEHIPDGEPYVFEDPDNPGKYRVYVYGSHDNLLDAYCGRDQVVWSAPVDDLNNWRYDGVIFENSRGSDGSLLNEGDVADVLYAPDVALYTAPDGKKTYYFYPNVQNGGRQGLIAKSDRPDGPFTTCNWSVNRPNETYGILRFDPAVFVDDDGKVYGYWGFEKSYGAELDPNTMCTLMPGTKVVEDMVSGRNDEGDFRFFEASSIRKIKDKYVFVYSRWTKDGEFGLPDTNYTLAYAYSDHPLGPWTYGGTIIDARGRETRPDGTVIFTATPSGNTHGGICEINGKWWVFYHRQSGTNEFCRQAMVAPIEVSVTEGPGGKVVISEGELTSEGFQTEGLPLSGTYPAGIACYFTGKEVARHEYPNNVFSGPYHQATYYDGDPATAPSDIKLKSAPMINNTDGGIFGYKYFNFDTATGDEMEMNVLLKPTGIPGKITIMAGSPYKKEGGVELGVLNIPKNTPKYAKPHRVTLKNLSKLSGKQPLYFVISSPKSGKSIADIYSFKF